MMKTDCMLCNICILRDFKMLIFISFYVAVGKWQIIKTRKKGQKKKKTGELNTREKDYCDGVFMHNKQQEDFQPTDSFRFMLMMNFLGVFVII